MRINLHSFLSSSFGSSILFLTLFSLLSSAAIAKTSEICSFFKPASGPLAKVNCDFHTQYEKRIQEMVKTFGTPQGFPVILNLGGTLVFKHNGKVEEVSINPNNYHYIKTFSHVAFSVYLVLSKNTSGRISIHTRQTLLDIQNHLKQAEHIIPTLGLSVEEKLISENIATFTDEFITKMLQKNYFSKQEFDDYYTKAQPMFAQAIKKAAEIELNLLNETVNRWLARLTLQEKQRLSVVVATSHQARSEEISIQYFAKKFGYHVGEGALHEKNFVVLEGKFDENSALELLARHYLDRQAAHTMLKNSNRLQRDLLADATKEIMDSNTSPLVREVAAKSSG